MFLGKLLNFELDRAAWSVISMQITACNVCTSIGRLTIRSRMSCIWKCNPRSMQQTNLLQ